MVQTAASSLIDSELIPPFDLVLPERLASAVVFNSPHSGRVYPQSFLEASRLDAFSLRRSEDAFVDQLVGGVTHAGTPLLAARFPRAYLDVNREPYELDPRMFADRLPGFANTRSLRVAGGLGTVARVVGESQEIYPDRLRVEDALLRIEHLYKPYHQALKRLLTEVHRLFGAVILVDCHSMPSAGSARDDSRRSDIVLGDRYATSCAPAVTGCMEDVLRSRGYTVARNKPYAGGFITEHYGAPHAGIHVVQIEINRALYMDEKRFEIGEGFDRLAQDILLMRDELAALPLACLDTFRTAAE